MKHIKNMIVKIVSLLMIGIIVFFGLRFLTKSSIHATSYIEYAGGDRDNQNQLSKQYSFVSTPMLHKGKLDEQTQQTFDFLIAGNIDGLLDLIAQSNNNLLSTDSCKTCAIDAILKKVSKHKELSESELVSLQHVVANLYKFVVTMEKLTHKNMLTAEQFLALKDLNTSDAARENIALQARQATLASALQSLNSINMIDKQG